MSAPKEVGWEKGARPPRPALTCGCPPEQNRSLPARARYRVLRQSRGATVPLFPSAPAHADLKWSAGTADRTG